MVASANELIDLILSVDGPEAQRPPGRFEAAQAPDSDDMIDTAELCDFVPFLVFLIYQDASGVISERQVTLRGLVTGPNGHPTLLGYCHVRRARRRFRIDRIREVIDCVTGERYDSPTALIDLLNLDETDTAVKQCRHGLTVLSYLARCDGHYCARERDVVLTYVRQIACDQDVDEDRLNWLLDRICPDAEVAVHSAKMLARGMGETSIRTLLDYAGCLIDADGFHAPEEIAFAQRLNGIRNHYI
ncbi:MAG: hypothetical protein RIM72_08770 [Alphaproteobacteria bacterium]